MSGFNYDKAAKTALNLITKFGATHKIRRATNTPPSNPWEPPTTSNTDYSCQAVVTEYSAREIDGVNILATDRRAVVAAAGLVIVPATTDLLLLDSTVYTIARVKHIKPADVVIAYELQVRNA